MSLPCCFTDETTPSCENRRHESSPMCLWHTKESIRRAIWDGSVPKDVLAELVQHTDWVVKVRQMGHDYEQAQRIVNHHATIRADERSKVAAESVVYYVKLTGGRIKIGWTSNLDQRLRTFRARASDVLAIEAGGQPVEAQRHRQFAHLRIGRSEEFRESPTLLNHIADLRASA